MKSILISATLLSVFTWGCQSEESSVYTGRELSYPLIEGSFFDQPTTGYLTVRERTDQSVEIAVALTGTTEGAIHPVHLHYGNLANDRPVAAWLSPLEDTGGGESRSVTRLDHLYDDSPLTFDLFVGMDGSLKVHFEEAGPWEYVVLGATNIGRNYSNADVTRYQDITLCNGQTGQ
jgi:hypothetical protein